MKPKLELENFMKPNLYLENHMKPRLPIEDSKLVFPEQIVCIVVLSHYQIQSTNIEKIKFLASHMKVCKSVAPRSCHTV